MKKRLISAIAGIAALAVPAVAVAAQPLWGQTYFGLGSGKYTYLTVSSKAKHSIYMSDNTREGAQQTKRCNSQYLWNVGGIKVGQRSGSWSTTRPNQLATTVKIHVTGKFTSRTTGHASWQVVGCSTKHSFKFKRGPQG